MSLSNERKPTHVRISDREKLYLQNYLGIANFSKAIRRVINSRPLLIDEELEEKLISIGFSQFHDHDAILETFKKAISYAGRHDFYAPEHE